MTKSCVRCKRVLDISCFAKNKNCKDGFHYECKKCSKERADLRKEKYANNPVAEKKVCSGCRVEKPASAFNRDRSQRDGLNHSCIECKKAEVGARRAKNLASGFVAERKVCPKCGVEKNSDQFGRDTSKSDGLYYCCKSCASNLFSGVVPEKKVCPICLLEKPSNEFHTDMRKASGLTSACKSCLKAKRDIKATRIKAVGFIALHKVCGTCGTDKAATEFRRNSSVPYGLWFECKPCAHIRREKKRLAGLSSTRPIPESQVCFTCKQEKPASEFWKDPMSKTGLFYNCRDCGKAKQNVRAQDPDFKKRSVERATLWQRTHKEKVRVNQTRYNERHKDSLLSYHRTYEREKYSNDINFHFRKVLRSRLRTALKLNRKSESTLNLVGCTLDFLCRRLESLFTKGMTYEKLIAGEIHIDHIIACAHFDLSDPLDQFLCFNWRNLQPLWGPDNIQKSARFDVHSSWNLTDVERAEIDRRKQDLMKWVFSATFDGLSDSCQNGCRSRLPSMSDFMKDAVPSDLIRKAHEASVRYFNSEEYLEGERRRVSGVAALMYQVVGAEVF